MVRKLRKRAAHGTDRSEMRRRKAEYPRDLKDMYNLISERLVRDGN